MQERVRLVRDALFESSHKTRFADPRLARDQHNLAFALPGELLACQKEIELVFAADQISQTRRVDRFEAALGCRHAINRPCGDRFGNTLDFVKAKIAQEEQIAEQPARGSGDDDGPRFDQGLQTRRQAWCVTNDGMLSQRALAAEVADHNQTGGYANADRERLFRSRLHPRDGSNDVERRAHGTLGIVLVRTRITEIGQYPVAPEIREEAIIGQRDTGAGGLKGIDDCTHVFRVELGR